MEEVFKSPREFPNKPRRLRDLSSVYPVDENVLLTEALGKFRGENLHGVGDCQSPLSSQSPPQIPAQDQAHSTEVTNPVHLAGLLATPETSASTALALELGTTSLRCGDKTSPQRTLNHRLRRSHCAPAPARSIQTSVPSPPPPPSRTPAAGGASGDSGAEDTGHSDRARRYIGGYRSPSLLGSSCSSCSSSSGESEENDFDAEGDSDEGGDEGCYDSGWSSPIDDDEEEELQLEADNRKTALVGGNTSAEIWKGGEHLGGQGALVFPARTLPGGETPAGVSQRPASGDAGSPQQAMET